MALLGTLGFASERGWGTAGIEYGRFVRSLTRLRSTLVGDVGVGILDL